MVAAATVVAIAAVVVPVLVLQGDDTRSAEQAQSAAAHGDAGTPVTDTPIDNLDPALASVAGRADRITYRSKSLAGRDVVVSGALLTPKGQAPEGGWPVVSWAHGSSGIIDQCAPSTALSKDGKVDLYGCSGFVSQLIGAGYAVAATDYEGLGTEGDHPYIVADSEGRSMIDAIRAAMQAEPTLSKKVFAVGHSQGGQAAIAAGELAETWGESLDFRGTIGIAPVTNVGQAYSYGSPGPVDRGFYLLALHGMKTVHPDLQFERHLGSQALEMLPKVSQECTGEIWTDFSADLGDKLHDYQFTSQDAAAAVQLQGWLDEQSVPRGEAPAPMLLLQGDQDPSIKAAVTPQAVKNARAAATVADFSLSGRGSLLGSRSPR